MNVWDQYAPELVTDLYEFTMAESYLKENMSGEATFSLFIRAYPHHRAYFVSAGLEHLLELIRDFRFSEASVDYLASTGKFSRDFTDYLKKVRFTGTVRAIPEGRIFFTQEPILEVTAPIIEGQLLETLVINVIQLETLLASKAARCVHAARGRALVDFSLRRTHGVDAGLKAARASYLAGFVGSSNVLAGKIYGVPVFGTMAHSYVTSFKNEMDSFLAFARTYPDDTVLLIDTYDTLRGAEKALEVARRMSAEGKPLVGVRLDSGDLVDLSRKVRKIFLDGGFPDVKIIVSGSLDEYSLEKLLEEGAEIDLFAVGTRMGVSSDAPYFDIAYKLVEYEGRPILKLSSGKKTWVGKKQVYRFYDEDGKMKEDLLCLLEEAVPGGEPLLETVIKDGELQRSPESLERIRERFAGEWEKLPHIYRSTYPVETYPVKISADLSELERQTSEARRREEIEKEW
ncbi:nicotinate phosphoribosyltransferase [Desulforhabdus amnigena]|jgi:nicotinate phosphoribosyltransferase|uniref:Nicotinate phosphoribosyltransferase n=1 Tax=Desulforhabdus amnigena TaxID=40218 RepID=A0A9W6FVF1_9BACT|nr:nicotinate phosphoribosyltransferase [Desulforhabdus amnigena]NLJ27933.1 nicotinate phosphoribosyltransferase [Deltaproteobacteria bacterium]GLI35599.1 nicotinate phosphoribosyltransferase [Desulforhabdus amnigena]